MLLQKTNYIFSPWKMSLEKNEICFKLFWYKVFVQWKLKSLNFLMDSTTALSQSNYRNFSCSGINCVMSPSFWPNPHISGYFLIRNSFFPDAASIHTYPVNPADESATFWIRSPEWKFLNTLWIPNRVDAKPGYFFIRWRNKIEPSSLS